MAILTVVAAMVLVPTVALQTARTSSSPAPQLLAFRGFGGGFHLGGSRYRSRGFFGFGRRSSSRGVLHSIARALAFAYIFHLFFSHGGLSIVLWILIIAVIAHLFRRRRTRNRYSY